LRDVTICLAYYENAGMFKRQCEGIRIAPQAMKDHVSLNVVDDGSPDNPAKPPDTPLGIKSFRLFRMEVDVPWNQDACRNLAVDQADDGWLLLTDMDHLVPIQTLRHVVFGDLDDGMVYQFTRVSEPEMQPYKPHPNSWLMTKSTYLKTGGYDERFAWVSYEQGWKDGIYGTDGRFRKQVEAVAKIKPFKAPLIRVPREVTPDASTTRYERRTSDMDARRTYVREYIKNSGQREPMIGMFPWVRVA